MAVKNSGNALVQLRTLFNVGAIGALSDCQLLEQFATGRGEPRELAFAALVDRHGPLVLRVCRSVLRDGDAAEDAFQATFLALARKAGSLWAQDSLASWLHQAAYRAAVHDRSATIRRRSHEHAAAALRPESVALPHHANDDDLEKIIHEELDRLPGRFRVAVVLCDLEGHTHEQAARHLGCAVGTVKSRLARGRKRLRGRLVRRGVAPALALAAASAGGAARAAVPTGLAESTVAYAATASAVPKSVAVITEGVLISMFLRKVKLVMTAAAVVAALAAGAVVLAQSGIGRPKDGTVKPQHVGSPSWTYHILVSRDGEPPRKVAVVEITGDTPIRVDAPGALILIQPKRQGVDPPAKAANGKTVSHPEPRYIEVRSVKPSEEAQAASGRPTIYRTPGSMVNPASEEAREEAQAASGRPTRILNYGLKYSDFDRVVETVPTIRKILPIREIRKQIRRGTYVLEGRVIGSTHEYAEFNLLQIEKGRFLTASDNEKYQNYAVLAHETAKTLFPDENPLNQSVKVGTDYYTVVGVTAERASSAGIGGRLAAQDYNKDVYIPLNTCKLRFGERIIDNRSGSMQAEETQLSRLILEVRHGADVEATAALVKSIHEPQHPKGDVEVVILKPDRKTK
jgi:RNA polymerase sigma factor (sigma-70 family)